MRRSRIPAAALKLLDAIPKSFMDDGCSNSPDSMFGFDFRWICRIHDWRYCTRCHRAGSMTAGARKRADRELRGWISQTMVWSLRWIKWIYWYGVWKYGGIAAFDSCGRDAGKICRHGQPKPEWMKSRVLRV